MKYFKLILSFALTIGVFFALNTKFGSIPPIGKFLNPYSGVWQNETDEAIDGEVLIPELKDKVTVHYDAQLIPHVLQSSRLFNGKTQIMANGVSDLCSGWSLI